MTKQERKSDHSSGRRPASRFITYDLELTPGEARLQRLLLMLLMVTLLTFIIVPKGVLTPSEFNPGDIAPRDIKAPHDLLIPDDDLTSSKRSEVEKAVPTLYDFDPSTGQAIAGRIAQIFNYLGKDPVPDVDTGEILAAIEQDLGIKIDPQYLTVYLELAKEPGSLNRIRSLLLRVYQQKVAGNLKLFETDRSQGVLFRNLETQAELADNPDSVVLGMGGLQDLVTEEIDKSEFNADQQAFLKTLILPLLRPNVSFNQNETEIRKQQAREAVQPVLVQVKKGEMIVREGDRITSDQLKKLDAMRDENNKGTRWRHAFGMFLGILLLMVIGHRFANRNVRKYQARNRDLFFLAATFIGLILLLKVSIFISTALGSAFSYVDQSTYYYAFPFAIGAMLIRIVLNSEFALVFILLSSIVIGLLFGSSFALLFFALLSSLAGAHWVKHVTERSYLYRAGVRLGAFNVLVILSLHLMTGKPFDLQLLYKICFGFSGGLIAAVIVTGVVPLIESLFRYTTNLKLLELANMNNPVLRDLMVQTPGTYHHSIIVGNLAEAAAETIGVNPLMVKVAAYYHDIGKIRKPSYFIENVGSKENKHDKLAPSMSALILMAHVKDGIEMARENRLGQQMIDIIRQHHGTSLMKFFYDRAKNMSDPEVQHIDERDYRYPGPKPQSREAALIMLADAIEAASRTLVDPTPARVQGMVQKIINNIFIDGQLDECELTLKDLHNIAKSFNKILGGIFHHRVDYPEPVSKERHAEKGLKKNGEDRDRKPPKESQNQEKPAPKGGADDLKRLGMS
ncbi:MAG: HDIG domain-containing protein [Deltaproteobacteria bacterium]|jgi:putative nucleotidyltransferase with HDIG domain|nr:HDIG domain-containing protein [Deltaproteobacteria bacterium]